MPEQSAPDLGQRQDTAKRAVSLREQVMGTMTKHPLENFAPPGAMKERRVPTARDERIPWALVAAGKLPDASGVGNRPRDVEVVHGCAFHHAAPARKTRSARLQRKSRTRRVNRGPILCRLR